MKLYEWSINMLINCKQNVQRFKVGLKVMCGQRHNFTSLKNYLLNLNL